jgi:hypothetical protein
LAISTEKEDEGLDIDCKNPELSKEYSFTYVPSDSSDEEFDPIIFFSFRCLVWNIFRVLVTIIKGYSERVMFFS